MKAIYLGGLLTLATLGCTTPGTLSLPNGETDNTSTNVVHAPSQRVRYQLNTQGLPEQGFWKSTPVLIDLNNDGILDLASHSRDQKSPQVWLGQAHNTWQDSSKGLVQSDDTCGGDLQFADLNKDNVLDMALADHCHGVLLYLGSKQNTWQLTNTLHSKLERKLAARNPVMNVLSGIEDLALGDINEDGAVDIVSVAADEGGFTVYLGKNSAKKWQETKQDGLPSAEDPGNEDAGGGWAVDVQLHDMNNDKHLDIVASYYSGPHVWLGDGKGHWQSKAVGLTVTEMQGTYRKLAVADINNDGLKDIAIANEISGAEAYLQNTDGSWKKTADMLPTLKAGATAIALGDLDGDSHIDAVIGGIEKVTDENSSGLHIVLGDGKGNWQHEQGSQLPSTGISEVRGLALVDLNADKRLDIVATTGDTASPATANKDKKTDTLKLPKLQVWLSEALDNSHNDSAK